MPLARPLTMSQSGPSEHPLITHGRNITTSVVGDLIQRADPDAGRLVALTVRSCEDWWVCTGITEEAGGLRALVAYRATFPCEGFEVADAGPIWAMRYAMDATSLYLGFQDIGTHWTRSTPPSSLRDHSDLTAIAYRSLLDTVKQMPGFDLGTAQFLSALRGPATYPWADLEAGALYEEQVWLRWLRHDLTADGTEVLEGVSPQVAMRNVRAVLGPAH